MAIRRPRFFRRLDATRPYIPKRPRIDQPFDSRCYDNLLDAFVRLELPVVHVCVCIRVRGQRFHHGSVAEVDGLPPGAMLVMDESVRDVVVSKIRLEKVKEVVWSNVKTAHGGRAGCRCIVAQAAIQSVKLVVRCCVRAKLVAIALYRIQTPDFVVPSEVDMHRIAMSAVQTDETLLLEEICTELMLADKLRFFTARQQTMVSVRDMVRDSIALPVRPQVVDRASGLELLVKMLDDIVARERILIELGSILMEYLPPNTNTLFEQIVCKSREIRTSLRSSQKSIEQFEQRIAYDCGYSSMASLKDNLLLKGVSHESISFLVRRAGLNQESRTTVGRSCVTEDCRARSRQRIRSHLAAALDMVAVPTLDKTVVLELFRTRWPQRVESYLRGETAMLAGEVAAHCLLDYNLDRLGVEIDRTSITQKLTKKTWENRGRGWKVLVGEVIAENMGRKTYRPQLIE